MRRPVSVIISLVMVLASVTAWAPTARAATFRDVPAGMAFAQEIEWLAARGITTGWREKNGTRTFRPFQPVNRDAMAAFLYRLAGSPRYVAPTKSPFADITPATQFYKEMAWLSASGISTGWREPNGTRTFRPLQPVNRDAMAAFMYRLAGKPAFSAPAKSPFADIKPTTQFYKEMAWLAGRGVSTGWREANGSRTYRPLESVKRDAMAAFMYRLFHKVGLKNAPKVVQERLITANEMLNARVPSLCMNKPGRLVNGRLPKSLLTHYNAFAEIQDLDGYGGVDWRKSSFVSWMGTDNKAYAALIVACNAGGVSWAPEIVLYASGPRLLGGLNAGSVVAGRQHAERLRAVNGGIRIDLPHSFQSDDAACCGTADAVADFWWTGSVVQGRQVAFYNEVPTAKLALAAAQSGNPTEIAKYFTVEGRKHIDTWGVEWNPNLELCMSASSSLWTLPGTEQADRVCAFLPAKQAYLNGVIGMKRMGFNQWKAVGMRVETTD